MKPTEPDPGWAAAMFNRLSRHATVRPVLDGERGAAPDLAWQEGDEYGRALTLLWRAHWPRLTWDRLKRCQRCRAWFVDHGKNRIAKWCSRRCNNRRYTRAYRKLVKRRRIAAGRPRPRRRRRSPA